MKKSELTELIREIVTEEVRSQIPLILKEAFKNVIRESNRGDLTESVKRQPLRQSDEPASTSLKELFAEHVEEPHLVQQIAPRQSRQFTKNPILNQILNETTNDLRSRESMVGGAAMMAGYSPTLNMVPGFDPASSSPMSQDVVEESFQANIPTMPASKVPRVFADNSIPAHNTPSALDMAPHVAPEVGRALTRNYSQLMKLVDKKKNK